MSAGKMYHRFNVSLRDILAKQAAKPSALMTSRLSRAIHGST
jgi:hypothetical protein